MVRLGELKQSAERLTFKDWCRRYYHDGVFPIRLLFPPKDYPSFSLIFEDTIAGKKYEIKLTVKADKFKDALKALGVQLKKADLPTLNVVVSNGAYGLEVGSDVDYILAWKGSYWVKEKVVNEDEEDLAIEF